MPGVLREHAEFRGTGCSALPEDAHINARNVRHMSLHAMLDKTWPYTRMSAVALTTFLLSRKNNYRRDPTPVYSVDTINVQIRVLFARAKYNFRW
jgi:hypothetical protein